MANTSSWAEDGPGTFRQPFGSLEESMNLFMNPIFWHGREYYILFLTCYFDLDGVSSSEAVSFLQNAWKATRFTNPDLAAAIDARGLEKHDLVYQVPDHEALEQWIKTTFVVVDKADVRIENYSHDLPPVAGLPTMYYFPQQSAVSLRFSHSTIGFRGMAMLLNRFFTNLTQPPVIKWGEEVQNLYPRFDELAGVAGSPTPEALQYVQGHFGEAMEGVPSTGFPMKANKGDVPLQTKHLTVELDEQSTAAMVTAVKKKGYTVTSVLHAALTVLVFEDAPQEQKGFSQIIGLFRDHRGFKGVPPEAKTDDYAIRNPLNGTLMAIKPGMNVDELAQWFTRKYRTEFDEVLHLSGFRVHAETYSAMLKSIPPDAPPSTMPRLSSVGIVEHFLKPTHPSSAGRGDKFSTTTTECKVQVRVRDVTLLAENPSTETTLWIYTWAGKLRLATVWNEAYYDDEYMASIFDRMIKLVGQNLGLSLQYTRGS